MRDISTDLAEGYALIEKSKHQSVKNFIIVMFIFAGCLGFWGVTLYLIMDSLEGAANSIAESYIEFERSK